MFSSFKKMTLVVTTGCLLQSPVHANNQSIEGSEADNSRKIVTSYENKSQSKSFLQRNKGKIIVFTTIAIIAVGAAAVFFLKSPGADSVEQQKRKIRNTQDTIRQMQGKSGSSSKNIRKKDPQTQHPKPSPETRASKIKKTYDSSGELNENARNFSDAARELRRQEENKAQKSFFSKLFSWKFLNKHIFD